MNYPAFVVDLDGTLIKTDSLWETFVETISDKPWLLILVPIWLLGGKARLKQKLAEHGLANVDNWPVNAHVLDMIKNAKEEGRVICLATAANEQVAQKMAGRINCFDGIIASNATVNMKGERKLLHIQRLLGDNAFDYAGDSFADLPVWAKCHHAILVGNVDSGLARAVKEINPSVQILERERAKPADYLRVIRMRHWSKNLLVAGLLLLSRDATFDNILAVLLTIISLSLCSSIVYVANDLIDINSDRLHPKKRTRPFAAGAIPLSHSAYILLVLAIGTALSAVCTPKSIHGVIAIYFIMNVMYSFWLKRILMLDVIVLAGFYVLRIVAGALAIRIWPSNWLIGFACFIFLGLALVKRMVELQVHSEAGSQTAHGRSYHIGDLQALFMMATASGFCSIAILAQYIVSLRAAELYQKPMILWGACPLLAYWYGRILIVSNRKEMHHDPIEFVMRDKVSIICVAIGLLLVAFAA